MLSLRSSLSTLRPICDARSRTWRRSGCVERSRRLRRRCAPNTHLSHPAPNPETQPRNPPPEPDPYPKTRSLPPLPPLPPQVASTGGTIPRIHIRYHPVYLDPSVEDSVAEPLESYLLRAHGVSASDAASESYPLNRAASALGFRWSASRRIVGTRRAFCALALAAAEGGRDAELHDYLARDYFEEGADISSAEVVCAALRRLRLPRLRSLSDGELQEAIDAYAPHVDARYASLVSLVPTVPCLVLRTGSHGDGSLLWGPKPISQYVTALRSLVRPRRSAAAGTHELLQPRGVAIEGLDGRPTRIADGNPTHPVSLLARGRRGYYESEWPYVGADFARKDERDDALMYSAPRFVSHLDTHALQALERSYRCLLAGYPHAEPAHLCAHPHLSAAGTLSGGKSPVPRVAILDTCASWKSYLPPELLSASETRVVVQGLNEAELAANGQATERLVCDLNEGAESLAAARGGGARGSDARATDGAAHPARGGGSQRTLLPFADGSFDLVSNVSSVGYLTDPRAVFGEFHRVLRPGGSVCVAFSNRCFEAKAVALWMRKVADGAALAEVVCNYLHFGALGGWAHINCVDISPEEGAGQGGDPLYLVVATKRPQGDGSKGASTQ